MSADQSIKPVEYRPVIGFPGYRVGDDGTVWSCWVRVRLGYARGTKCVIGTEWKRLKAKPNSRGYPRVTLCRDGKIVQRTVHRIVLEAFVGPRPQGLQCCHEDDVKTNNSLTNLRWGTPKSNQADSIRNGTFCRGERQGGSKLKKNDVLRIRIRHEQGASLSAIAQEHGVTKSCVADVVKGRSWSWLQATTVNTISFARTSEPKTP